MCVLRSTYAEAHLSTAVSEPQITRAEIRSIGDKSSTVVLVAFITLQAVKHSMLFLLHSIVVQFELKVPT